MEAALLVEYSQPWEHYEHEQLDNMHISVPEHRYQYDDTFMSSVLSYEQLSCIVIKSAVSISHLKVLINTK